MAALGSDNTDNYEEDTMRHRNPHALFIAALFASGTGTRAFTMSCLRCNSAAAAPRYQAGATSRKISCNNSR